MKSAPKKAVVIKKASRFVPAEVVIETIMVGIGLFEAAIFALGGLAARLPVATLAVGIIYFLLPYNLLTAGFALPGRFLHVATWQRNLAIIVLNVPFILYLGLQGSLAANGLLAALIVLGLLMNVPKIGLRNIPGLDVISLSLFLAGPFVYGAVLSGAEGLWWLPAWLSMLMVVAANYLMYKLPMIGFDRQVHYDGIDVRLGLEYSLVVAMGLYMAAALLPTIAYGWTGVPATVLLLWYVVVAFQALPFRLIAGAAGLYRVWRAIWWLNYPVGALLAVYAAVLIARTT